MRPILAMTVTILCACSMPPATKHQGVPADLVPAGFTADECWIEKPGETMTTNGGPGGAPIASGEKGPEVRCHKKEGGPVETVSKPVCHTQSGKLLPLSDCCMTESGDPIPACTPKLQPPE